MLLLLLFMVLSLSFASKRPADKSQSEDPRRPLKRPRLAIEPPAENLEIESLDNFPDDILAYIVTKMLDGFPLRSEFINPLGFMYALSKRWFTLLSGPYFVPHLRSNANAALHLLRLNNFEGIGLDNNFDLLEASAPILNLNEKLECMNLATDMETLRFLAALPGYTQITREDYANYLNSLLPIVHHIYPAILTQKDRILGGPDPLPISDRMFIFAVPPEIILKLLFLDDLYRPTEYTWIFSAIAKSICHIYFKDRRYLPQLSVWLQDFAKLDLPFTKIDLLAETMLWPVLLATLTEDWDFLEFLPIDYENFKTRDEIREAFKITKAVGQCIKLRNSSFLSAVEKTIEAVIRCFIHYDFMGFDKVKLREIFLEYSLKFTNPDTLAKIQKLINSA